MSLAWPSTLRNEKEPVQSIQIQYLCLHPLTLNDQNRRGNTSGGGLVLGGQPRPPSQGSVALADPNFAGSPPLMHTRFDLEPPNSAAW